VATNAAASSTLMSGSTNQSHELDLTAALSQMTDVAQEVLGEEAAQGSLRGDQAGPAAQGGVR
jgi:hypothetical protein